MKFEDALEKSERMHARIVDPAPGNEPHDMEDLIAADAKLKNHCRNILPRLLRAVEAERDAHAAFIGGADNSAGRWSSALTELRLAIAAAKDIPDA